MLWLWIAVVSMASPVLMLLFSPYLKTDSHESSNSHVLVGNDNGDDDVETSMQLLPDSDSDNSDNGARNEGEDAESDAYGGR
jgi:hypothetical protein